jgi:4'-phosphopantetheinyl transferase
VADLTEPTGVLVVWLVGGTGPDTAGRLLRRELAGEVEVHRLCPQCGSSGHGRPLVVRRDGGPVPFVSLSRTADCAIVAVSDAGPVGVDIERSDAARFSGLADVALHPAEESSSIEALARTWVRKESLLKATGDGLRVDPRALRVSAADQPPQLVEWTGRELPAAQMHDLDIPGHVACVTLLADTDVPVRTRQAAPGDLSA